MARSTLDLKEWSYEEPQRSGDSSGWLIQGDAAHALEVIRQDLVNNSDGEDRIQLCYIDPPFNTGETFKHYHDSKNSDDWIRDLRERLLQIKQILAHDGSVWLHLDDSEQHRARVVLDEVFGRAAFVATIIWQKRTTRESRTAFSSMHDYIHVYAPNGPKQWKLRRNPLPEKGTFSNPDADPKGPWRSSPVSVQAGHATRSQFYTVTTPTGVKHDPPTGRCWAYNQMRLQELDREGRIYWPSGGNGKPRLKRYESEVMGSTPFTLWFAEEVGDTSEAKKSLMSAFPDIPTFDTPKPERLLERIINIATNEGERILDCYLGSGTTAVVANRLNRKWVGVEMNPITIQDFILPRLGMHSDGLSEIRFGTVNSNDSIQVKSKLTA